MVDRSKVDFHLISVYHLIVIFDIGRYLLILVLVLENFRSSSFDCVIFKLKKNFSKISNYNNRLRIESQDVLSWTYFLNYNKNDSTILIFSVLEHHSSKYL